MCLKSNALCMCLKSNALCLLQSHYAVQCEALDGTPLPAPLCKLLRIPQGSKWGRENAPAPVPVPAPRPAMTIQAREEEC
jgi:hypothetical protein